jgi:hypothetical protein
MSPIIELAQPSAFKIGDELYIAWAGPDRVTLEPCPVCLGTLWTQIMPTNTEVRCGFCAASDHAGTVAMHGPTSGVKRAQLTGITVEYSKHTDSWEWRYTFWDGVDSLTLYHRDNAVFESEAEAWARSEVIRSEIEAATRRHFAKSIEHGKARQAEILGNCRKKIAQLQDQIEQYYEIAPGLRPGSQTTTSIP